MSGAPPPPPPSLAAKQKAQREELEAPPPTLKDLPPPHVDAGATPLPAIPPHPPAALPALPIAGLGADEPTVEIDAVLDADDEDDRRTPPSGTSPGVPPGPPPVDEFEDEDDDVPAPSNAPPPTAPGSSPSSGTSPTAKAKRTMMGIAPAAPPPPPPAVAPQRSPSGTSPSLAQLGSNPFPVAAPVASPASATKTVLGMPRVQPPTPSTAPPPPAVTPPPPLAAVPSFRPGATPPPPPLSRATPARPVSTLPPPPGLPTPPTSNKTVYGLLGVVAALIVGLVAMILQLLSGSGSLTVSVSGSENEAVQGTKIFVDGKQVCSESPCRVNEIEEGTHFLRVEAPGYTATAEQAINVTSGKDATRHVTLARSADGSGLEVESSTPGLTLRVDGKEIGPLPQSLPDLSLGSHTVVVEGGDRFKPFEQQVVLEAGRKTKLGPIQLELLKGLLELRAGENANGARVTVDGNDERVPSRIEVTPDVSHEIRATRRGYETFVESVVLDASHPEATVTISLEPETRGEAEGPRGSSAHTTPSRSAASAPATESSSDTTATLNVNSIPSSKVVVDGKPLGRTPRMGVSVKPGAHTVIFIHSKHGRKSQQVHVAAGQKKSVVVRFP